MRAYDSSGSLRAETRYRTEWIGVFAAEKKVRGVLGNREREREEREREGEGEEEGEWEEERERGSRGKRRKQMNEESRSRRSIRRTRGRRRKRKKKEKSHSHSLFADQCCMGRHCSSSRHNGSKDELPLPIVILSYIFSFSSHVLICNSYLPVPMGGASRVENISEKAHYELYITSSSSLFKIFFLISSLLLDMAAVIWVWVRCFGADDMIQRKHLEDYRRNWEWFVFLRMVMFLACVKQLADCLIQSLPGESLSLPYK